MNQIQGCRELLKENSTALSQSGTSSETEGQGTSKPRGKRRRDSLQKEKGKEDEIIISAFEEIQDQSREHQFPSDLNVEEFFIEASI
ncbi:hypothetical protein OS493_040358 [Desmophyllum pertusum]|uniref:Uncharacterized protein n=1 Tax=Desmophyllum pertusum TaxID=174260 RepID=A0A9W9Y6Q8_9CNID|nr:hypothetical protein OS493_040358 [Desmophyllum pertusum]